MSNVLSSLLTRAAFLLSIVGVASFVLLAQEPASADRGDFAFGDSLGVAGEWLNNAAKQVGGVQTSIREGVWDRWHAVASKLDIADLAMKREAFVAGQVPFATTGAVLAAALICASLVWLLSLASSSRQRRTRYKYDFADFPDDEVATEAEREVERGDH